MKNVYFVQVSYVYGESIYLPYATGCLAAYSWRDEKIKNEYNLAGFIFRRDALDKVIEEIKEPYIVAFSCSNCTFEYNNRLAAMIKERFPKCIIIYGGHNVPNDNSILKKFSFVDYLIHGEGEVPFFKLLNAFSGRESIEDIENISYREKNGNSVKTKFIYYGSVEGYPSPYLDGIFDPIIKKEPETVFCTIVETNRGCPYKCSYCDWCFAKKLKLFDIKKVTAEIEWMAEHRVEYIFCADSNFGIVNRDLEIANRIVEIKKRTGYPHTFVGSLAKNNADIVFEIAKLFYDNKLNKAANLAYQTLDATTLKNVNRENFTMEAFSEIAAKYNSAGIPTYTEMILGLPGETYDSFCSGLCKLIEAGQQSSISVYSCQVYCNSELGDKAYRDKFGIKTSLLPMNHIHSSEMDKSRITEYTEVVTETATMSREDMVKSILFCTCLQSFHHMGLLKCFAVYLRHEHKVEYIDFYNSLLDFFFEKPGTMLYDLFSRIREICRDCETGEWTYFNKKFGDLGWFLEEGAFLEIVSDYEKFWSEITVFLDRFNIDPVIYEQLKKYQKFIIRMPNHEIVSEKFDYDFYHYFIGIFSRDEKSLEKAKNKITVKIAEPVYDWVDYALKVVLYAKRRGDTVLTNARRDVTFEKI